MDSDRLKELGVIYMVMQTLYLQNLFADVKFLTGKILKTSLLTNINGFSIPVVQCAIDFTDTGNNITSNCMIILWSTLIQKWKWMILHYKIILSRCEYSCWIPIFIFCIFSLVLPHVSNPGIISNNMLLKLQLVNGSCFLTMLFLQKIKVHLSNHQVKDKCKCSNQILI